jgi:hypothetical protein
LPERTPPAERPPASEASLAPGSALGIRPLTIDRVVLSTYLDEIRETDPIYRAEGLVHPGQILRLANQALVQNDRAKRDRRLFRRSGRGRARSGDCPD